MHSPRRLTSLPPGIARLLWIAILGLPAVGLGLISLRLAYGPRDYYDFHIFWHAGQAAMHGQSPYPPITDAALRHQDQFVYPAPAAIALIPLGLLPLGAAATLFIILNVAATITALRLVGVRDWRCHAMVFCSIATIQSVIMGTFTPLLLLGAAAAWRWRRNRATSAGAIAALTVVKLFLAPLAVWHAAMRRYVTAALALALAAAVTLLCWALLAFHGFTTYPSLLAAVSRLEQQKGFSLIALVTGLGGGVTAGKLASYLAGAGLCAAAWMLAGRRDGERRAFTLTLVAGLALSPIVWLNYFLLLALPLALRRPRLGPAWLLMLTPWIFANANTAAPVWKVIAFWTGTAAIVWVVTRADPSDEAAEPVPAEADPVDVRVLQVSRSTHA